MNTEIALTRDIIRFSIRQSAAWRLSLCQRYPADSRNRPAADTLAAIAADENCSDALLAEVVRTIPDIRTAVSTAAREVYFRRPVETLDGFMALMLEQPSEVSN